MKIIPTPPKDKKKPLHFLLNESYIKDYDLICEKFNISRIEFLRQAISEGLKAVEAEK